MRGRLPEHKYKKYAENIKINFGKDTLEYTYEDNKSTKPKNSIKEELKNYSLQERQKIREQKRMAKKIRKAKERQKRRKEKEEKATKKQEIY